MTASQTADRLISCRCSMGINLTTPVVLSMHQFMRRVPRVRAFADFVAAEIGSMRTVLGGQ